MHDAQWRGTGLRGYTAHNSWLTGVVSTGVQKGAMHGLILYLEAP